jgi:hypothetical protein
MSGTQESTRTPKTGATLYGWAGMTGHWDQFVAQIGAQSSENLDTWLASLSAFADAQKTLLERTAAYSEKALVSQWEAAKAVGSAQSPAAAARIHAALAPQTIDRCVREATELFQVASEGAAATLQPFRARASSLMKTAQADA